jgi:hypothetical protein
MSEVDTAGLEFLAPHRTKSNGSFRGRCFHFDTYGLGCDEAEALWGRAGSCCEICGIPEAEAPTGLYIDHNPRAGYNAVRGILCVACNRRLDDLRLWPWPAWFAYRAAHYFANAWCGRPEAQAVIRRKPKIAEIRRNFRFGITGTDRVIHSVIDWRPGLTWAYCSTVVRMPFWRSDAEGFTRCERCPEAYTESISRSHIKA